MGQELDREEARVLRRAGAGGAPPARCLPRLRVAGAPAPLRLGGTSASRLLPQSRRALGRGSRRSREPAASKVADARIKAVWSNG